VSDTLGAPTLTQNAREAKQPRFFEIPPDIYTVLSYFEKKKTINYLFNEKLPTLLRKISNLKFVHALVGGI
jgi:hypothetical protein